MGAVQLYPEDPSVGPFQNSSFFGYWTSFFFPDRRPALKSILTTMLFTYSSFLSSVVAPTPPPYAAEIPPDWDRLLEWMRVMGQNLIAAANDLRPIQVRLQRYRLYISSLRLNYFRRLEPI